MDEIKYELIINQGQSYQREYLEKYDFCLRAARLLKEPKKVFMGMGNFLELGDYNNIIDSILFTEEGVELEKILDRNNRKMSAKGNIPFSFFKFGVYYPDFLLKDVPVSCISTVGRKARLVPGAEFLMKHLRKYNPLVLTAIPYEIAIELAQRLDLGKESLVATNYKVGQDETKAQVYTGGIHRFISGDRKSIEIERFMIDNTLTEDEVIYIGSGEAGLKTFSKVSNSIAFNPSENIIPESRINVYGSSLESLLPLFNFGGSLDRHLHSDHMEENLPSLIVYSEVREKSEELIDIELSHARFQKNILGQRVEYSGASYDSVLQEIDVALRGSSVDIEKVRTMINERIRKFAKDPNMFVREVYGIAKERYKALGTA